jgi:hypothetical protein
MPGPVTWHQRLLSSAIASGATLQNSALFVLFGLGSWVAINGLWVPSQTGPDLQESSPSFLLLLRRHLRAGHLLLISVLPFSWATSVHFYMLLLVVELFVFFLLFLSSHCSKHPQHVRGFSSDRVSLSFSLALSVAFCSPFFGTMSLSSLEVIGVWL